MSSTADRQGGTHILRSLFLTFAKIGAFTFGGGWAMIAIMEKEIVNKHAWLSKEEFLDQLAVAQAMPGILAVNISVAVGDKIRGGIGSLCAALGTILPSFCIILAIAIFLTPDIIKNDPIVSKVFMGIRPAVVALIVAPVFTTARSAGISWRTAWIPICAALLIWSGIPYISNPILYVILGAFGGWLWYGRRFALEAKKGVEDK